MEGLITDTFFMGRTVPLFLWVPAADSAPRLPLLDLLVDFLFFRSSVAAGDTETACGSGLLLVEVSQSGELETTVTEGLAARGLGGTGVEAGDPTKEPERL